MVRTMKRIMILLVCVLVCFQLSAILPQACAFADDEAEKDYTLMVYMVGSDLESDYGEATRAMGQMLSAADREKTNILCMTGGATRWISGSQDPEKICIYQISGASRRRPVKIWEGPKMNMGEPETLQFFLNYCDENFPAKNCMLILWGYGAGPQKGFGFDYLYDRDPLTLAEMDQAFRGSPFNGEKKLSWIIFDSCFMGNLEVAQSLSPYASYLVADELSGTGFYYQFLNVLNAQTSTEEVSKAIVDDYYQSANTMRTDISISCVNLSELNPVLEARNNLISALKEQTDEMLFKKILAESNLTDRLKYVGLEYKLYDLGLLALNSKEYTPQEADALLEALKTAVVYTQGNVENAVGLSIYIDNAE